MRYPIFKWRLGLALLWVAGCASAGPVGSYYLTDPQDGAILAIYGDAWGATARVHGGEEGPLAVDGSVVRAMGMLNDASGFETGVISHRAVALDRDGTLWLAGCAGSGCIGHYSSAGDCLGIAFYPGLGCALGGEIGVPEPSARALLVAGFAATSPPIQAASGFYPLSPPSR